MYLEAIIFILLSYLIGSIPFGLVITKIFTNKNITKQGSGNIGATNVVRSAGKKLGYATFALDASKALISLLIFEKLVGTNLLYLNLVVLAVILGHCFPVWLKFKGGKGVATLVGGIFYYDPILTTIIAICWYIIFYITRIVSIASIVILAVIAIYFSIKFSLVFTGFIIAPIVCIYRHKDNIKRILEGKEKSF
ncbi:MAG: glycerol-3-phosphate 1-O-acyltransferase PlsY [Rickettsiales bacterium]|nr:glycerol-3-phosphate 1-O-acyltransferase PlsY [Rickettsiales bacterium]